MNTCESCKNRNENGKCQSDKLSEDWDQSDTEKADMLLYDYTEDGGFWVGENFGCVHHTSNV